MHKRQKVRQKDAGCFFEWNLFSGEGDLFGSSAIEHIVFTFTIFKNIAYHFRHY